MDGMWVFVRRQWRRNQDSNMVTADSVYITRDTKACPNKATYAPYSSDASLKGLRSNPNFDKSDGVQVEVSLGKVLIDVYPIGFGG